MDEDKRVLEAALKVMTRALDELLTACADGQPDRRAIMRARSMLPPGYVNSLQDKKGRVIP